MIIQLLTDLASEYSNQIKNLLESKSFMINPDYVVLAKLESRYEKMANAHAKIYSNKNNFVIDDFTFR